MGWGSDGGLDSRFQALGIVVVGAAAVLATGLRRGRDIANLRSDLRGLQEALQGVTAAQRSSAHSLSATLRAQERKTTYASDRTGSALSDLKVRLTQVDTANRTLRELTGQVSELQTRPAINCRAPSIVWFGWFPYYTVHFAFQTWRMPFLCEGFMVI